MHDRGLSLYDSPLAVTAKKVSGYDKYTQVFAVFINDTLRGKEATDYFLSVHSNLLREFKKNKIGAWDSDSSFCGLISVEGGAVLAGDPDNVRILRDKGVRILTLTWNGECELGYGHIRNRGLKAFGKEVLGLCESVGIIPDVSHLSERGFDDVCEIYSRPFLATHSNARKICNNSRNLCDSQLKTLFSRGCLVGINFYKHFLSDENAGEDDVYRHISHMLSLGGGKHIALGSDYDGADIPWSFSDASRLDSLYGYLLSRGLKEATLDDIFYNNAYRFFEKNLV